MTLDEYLEMYGGNPDNRIVVNPDPEDDKCGWPTILIRRGNNALVLHLCALDGDRPHVFVDARAFVDGHEARTGVFGMEAGRRYVLEPTGRTSHDWPAAMGVTLLAGEQG